MITLWDGSDFAGAKLAALHAGHILTYRRDDKPGIPWPGRIDLPGGGREGGESPATCALRELHEEFGLLIPESRLWWARPFAAVDAPGRTSWFLAVHLAAAEMAAICFGDEGHTPQMLEIGAFLATQDGIPALQHRVRLVLASGPDDMVSGYHTPKTPLFP